MSSLPNTAPASSAYPLTLSPSHSHHAPASSTHPSALHLSQSQSHSHHALSTHPPSQFNFNSAPSPTYPSSHSNNAPSSPSTHLSALQSLASHSNNRSTYLDDAAADAVDDPIPPFVSSAVMPLQPFSQSSRQPSLSLPPSRQPSLSLPLHMQVKRSAPPKQKQVRPLKVSKPSARKQKKPAPLPFSSQKIATLVATIDASTLSKEHKQLLNRVAKIKLEETDKIKNAKAAAHFAALSMKKLNEKALLTVDTVKKARDVMFPSVANKKCYLHGTHSWPESIGGLQRLEDEVGKYTIDAEDSFLAKLYAAMLDDAPVWWSTVQENIDIVVEEAEEETEEETEDDADDDADGESNHDADDADSNDRDDADDLFQSFIAEDEIEIVIDDKNSNNRKRPLSAIASIDDDEMDGMLQPPLRQRRMSEMFQKWGIAVDPDKLSELLKVLNEDHC